MGIAILSGILTYLYGSSESGSAAPSSSEESAQGMSGLSTPAEETPVRLPSRFIACVRREEAAKRIRTSLGAHAGRVEILKHDNVRGVQQGDVILLCCKPQMVANILHNEDASAPAPSSSSPTTAARDGKDASSSPSTAKAKAREAMVDALEGKLLISICAGVSVAQIEEILYGSVSDNDPAADGRCRIVRAMPNTAAFIRQSMTVVSQPRVPLPAPLAAVTTWIFSRIGRVVALPPAGMDACTALCGSGPAFLALVLEALADGAVAMGLPRAESQLMAAQTMLGTAGLVLNGRHPALVREDVATPGGCTIGGLLVLEEGMARGTLARAVRQATVVASKLGQGVEGVNGTKF
jgi:pyrroline-5-carboxylate reductase